MAEDTKPFDSYITEPKPGRPAKAAPSVLYTCFKPLASLQLTVTLFVLAVILVFYGTMAQRTISTWDAVDTYFRSSFVMIPNQLNAEFCKIFFGLDKDTTWNGRFPFPGGWTLGAIFLVNLISAHIVRFKITIDKEAIRKSRDSFPGGWGLGTVFLVFLVAAHVVRSKLFWKRSGMILIHSGVVVLLLGELVTGMKAVEGAMAIKVGEASNVVEIYRQYELAFVLPRDGKFEEGVTIDGSLLKPGVRISHPDLPVEVEVVEYWANTAPMKWGPAMPGGKDVIVLRNEDGRREWVKLEKADKSSGSDAGSREDAPSVLVRLISKGGEGAEPAKTEKLLSTYHTMFESRGGVLEDPNTVTAKAGDPVYRVQFRNKRIVKPYRLELKKFEHKKYPGSDIPRDFASTVQLKDDRSGEDREVRVWMNHPLTYEGDTFYQHQTLVGDSGTVLMVVKNPGAILPYLSCAMVTLGMLVHFGISLNKHLAKRAVK